MRWCWVEVEWTLVFGFALTICVVKINVIAGVFFELLVGLSSGPSPVYSSCVVRCMSAADAPDDGQSHLLLAFRFRRAYRRIVSREHFVRFCGETAVV